MSNYIKNVAVVGAGGNLGKFIAEALLKTGKHVVTGISRSESTSECPKGVIVKKVNYDDKSTLVDAMKGQDALVITMASLAPATQEEALVEAAAEAGVPWILPNDWSPNSENEGLIEDLPPFKPKRDIRKLVLKLGKSSYVAVSTGFWYEWSVSIANAFGFDLANRKVTFFDEGETRITTSTWPQVGRTVAKLLSLPIQPLEGSNAKICLQNFKNQVIYVSSFTVSQKEILDSILRVTQSKIDDWEITKEPVKERFTKSKELWEKGDRAGFVRALYSRVFYPDGCGNSEKARGLSNDVLGLLREDLDDATRAAIERAKQIACHE